MSEGLEDYNPKKERMRNQTKSKSIAFKIATVENYFGEELQDASDVIKMYKKWPFVPYAGTDTVSNDSLLYFFDSAKFISPTQGACHNSIKSFLFGGKIKIEYSQNEDFDLDEEIIPVPTLLKKEYADFVSTIRSQGQTIKKLSCDFYEEIASNGNIFIELVHTVTDGVKSSAFYLHPTKHCKYWETLKDQPMMIGISEIFTDQYLKDNPPKIIPIFPNYEQHPDGTQRTIIHIKNGNFKYYGRPYYVGASIDVYSEYKERLYLTNIAASNFTGQGIIEAEDDEMIGGIETENQDAIEEGYGDINDRFDKNFRSDSEDPQNFLFSTRPFGAKPMFVHEFKLHTSESFYKTIGGMHRQAIIENNAWSERLLGNSVSEGFSKDNYIAEAKIKDISILEIYSGHIRDALTLVFTESAKWQEKSNLLDLGVSIPSSVQKLVNMQKADFETLVGSYGTAVRAGVITSTEADEDFFREKLGLIEANDSVRDSWKEDGGYRRPITLKAAEDSESEQVDPKPK